MARAMSPSDLSEYPGSINRTDSNERTIIFNILYEHGTTVRQGEIKGNVSCNDERLSIRNDSDFF